MAALRDHDGSETGTVVAVATSGDRLFWLETSSGADRSATAAVWSAGADGTSPHVLATDPAEVLYANSQDDMQVADGRVYWATRRLDRHTEIHSVGVNGSPKSAQILNGAYTLSTWPWATATTGANPRKSGPQSRLQRPPPQPPHRRPADRPCRPGPATHVYSCLVPGLLCPGNQRHLCRPAAGWHR